MSVDTDVPAERPGRAVEDVLPDPLHGPGGRLLIGYDGSPASVVALRWVLSRVGRHPGSVQLVGVVDDDAGSMGRSFADENATTLARLLSRTAEETEAAHPGIIVDTILTQGSVAAALAHAAARDDLIVVGSDKTGYARGRLYGSRSFQVVAAASSTVAVVPSVDLRLREGVVVALDDTEHAASLARIGAREAAARHSALVLVHAIPAESGPDRRAGADATVAAARAVVAGESPELEVSTFLAERRPAEAILNLTREKSLLIVGRSRRPEPSAIGGTLHELLTNANVPVVVVR